MNRLSVTICVALAALILNQSCTERSSSIKPVSIKLDGITHTVSVKNLSHTSGCKLNLESAFGSDAVLFRYQPYHLDTGDINNDGKTDILIGLIKPTRFDPGLNKRLFILQIDEGKMRPLWLGSKTCRKLYQFRTASSGTQTLVKTIEEMNGDEYAVGDYQWQGFGLVLIRYQQEKITLTKAYEYFNQN